MKSIIMTTIIMQTIITETEITVNQYYVNSTPHQRRDQPGGAGRAAAAAGRHAPGLGSFGAGWKKRRQGKRS